MTQKEALYQHVHPDLTDRWGQPVTEAVLAAITTYHQNQVKKCDLGDVGERSPDYIRWWASQDDVNRCRLIKEKSIDVNRQHKRMVKAMEKRMEYGFNRSGQRGGRFTSLAAHEERCTTAYLDAVSELKYMCARI